MVSNEIKRRFRGQNRTIVCESCNETYELKEGESLEDFESCSCGGKLRYENLSYDKVKPEKPNSNKTIIGIAGFCIILLILSILFLPGLFATNKTFSKGGISFQYPNSWSDNKTFNFVRSGNQSSLLGTVGDDSMSMAIASLNLSQHSEFNNINMNADDLLSLYVKYNHNLQEPNIQKLGLNTVTVNNKTAYEEIYTSKDPVTNEPCKTVNLFISNNGVIYSILFKTSEKDFEKLYSKIKEIESSIKFEQ